jgi:hypothetical protein
MIMIELKDKGDKRYKSRTRKRYKRDKRINLENWRS